MGINPQDVIGANLSNEGLNRVIAQTNPFVNSRSGTSGFQFGATQTVKKDDGSLVSVTQVRDPNTGSVRVVESPIAGQLVSGIGETAGERQDREVSTAIEKTTGTGGAETTVLEEREEVLRPGPSRDGCSAHGG